MPLLILVSPPIDFSMLLQFAIIIFGGGGVIMAARGMIKGQINEYKIEVLESENKDLKAQIRELQKKIDEKNEAILKHLK